MTKGAARIRLPPVRTNFLKTNQNDSDEEEKEDMETNPNDDDEEEKIEIADLTNSTIIQMYYEFLKRREPTEWLLIEFLTFL